MKKIFAYTMLILLVAGNLFCFNLIGEPKNIPDIYTEELQQEVVKFKAVMSIKEKADLLLQKEEYNQALETYDTALEEFEKLDLVLLLSKKDSTVLFEGRVCHIKKLLVKSLIAEKDYLAERFYDQAQILKMDTEKEFSRISPVFYPEFEKIYILTVKCKERLGMTKKYYPPLRAESPGHFIDNDVFKQQHTFGQRITGTH